MSKTKIIVASLVVLGLIASVGIYTNYYKTSQLNSQQLVTTPAVDQNSKSSTTTSAVMAPITTPGSTCLNFTVDMQYGDSDSKEFKGIATLQKYLRNEGYYGKDLPITGNYGDETAIALNKFRVTHGLYKNKTSVGQPNIDNWMYIFDSKFVPEYMRYKIREYTKCNMDVSQQELEKNLKTKLIENLNSGQKADIVSYDYGLTNMDGIYVNAITKIDPTTSWGDQDKNTLRVGGTIFMPELKKYAYEIYQDVSALENGKEVGCGGCMGTTRTYLTFDGKNFTDVPVAFYKAHVSLLLDKVIGDKIYYTIADDNIENVCTHLIFTLQNNVFKLTSQEEGKACVSNY